MFDALVEPFQFSFMQRALLAGCLAVLSASVVGTWVVIRGLSFMGEALSHGVLPGVALAFLWGFDLTLGALASAGVMAAGVNLVTRRSPLGEDTGIGLLLVGMLALGVVVVSRSRSYAGDLTSFLFGSVLGVTDRDLLVSATCAAGILAATVLLRRPFLALSSSRDTAVLLHLRPTLAHLGMLALIGFAVVASFRAVGTLLVVGLLIAPPATASLLVRRVASTMVLAVALEWFAVWLGLWLSYHLDTAAGATMAGVAVGQFFVVLAASELVTRIGRLRLRRGEPPRQPIPQGEHEPRWPSTSPR